MNYEFDFAKIEGKFWRKVLKNKIWFVIEVLSNLQNLSSRTSVFAYSQKNEHPKKQNNSTNNDKIDKWMNELKFDLSHLLPFLFASLRFRIVYSLKKSRNLQ